VTGLGDLLQRLFDHLAMLVPWAIVQPWEQAIIVRWGVLRKLALADNGLRGSGFHPRWPIVDYVYQQECNLEVFETEPQTVAGLTFTLGLQFRVTRLDLYYVRINDPASAVADVVRSAAAEIARDAKPGPEFGDAVATLAKKRMHGWGVDLIRVAPITLTECPVLRIVTGRVAPVAKEEAAA
jgi:regulator of protease activity HflC (stomatin/prohibitin superfamily)